MEVGEQTLEAEAEREAEVGMVVVGRLVGGGVVWSSTCLE